MSKYSDAADVIKRQAKQYQALIDAASALEEIGHIENVAKEAKARAAEAQAELEAAQVELAKAKSDTKRAKEQAKQILDGAVIDANDQAAQLQKAAEEQHAEIVKRAQDMAAAMLEQAGTQRAKANAEITSLQQAAQQLKSEIQSLTNAKAEVIAQYDDADKKLAALKAKLKALMD